MTFNEALLYHHRVDFPTAEKALLDIQAEEDWEYGQHTIYVKAFVYFYDAKMKYIGTKEISDLDTLLDEVITTVESLGEAN